MSSAWVDGRANWARLEGFLAELIERAGLTPRFRPADLMEGSNTAGVIVGDGYELELTFMNQAPAGFSTWWHLTFPGPEAWTGPLMWTGLPVAGWRRPKSAEREASLAEGCETLARLPYGIDELTAAAESALVNDGTSSFEYGYAVALCLGGRALQGLDVGQAWVNSLINTIVERNEHRTVDHWGYDPRISSLHPAVASEVYAALAQVHVSMNWDPVERPAHPMRRPSLAVLRRGLALDPARVSIDLGPRASLTATLTEDDLTFTLEQSWFDWEVLPFPVAAVSVPRPAGDTSEVSDTIRHWMSRRGFLDLSRRMIGDAHGKPDGAWNWSVICSIIEGARRETLSFRQQQDICDALDVEEPPPWSAVSTAVASVATAFLERQRAH